MSQRALVVHAAPKSASSTAVISLSVYTILMQRCATFSTAHHSSKCMLLLTTQTSECDTIWLLGSSCNLFISINQLFDFSEILLKEIRFYCCHECCHCHNYKKKHTCESECVVPALNKVHVQLWTTCLDYLFYGFKGQSTESHLLPLDWATLYCFNPVLTWMALGSAKGNSASMGTTHGEMEVPKFFPRKGPRGTYSQAWMSLAENEHNITAGYVSVHVDKILSGNATFGK